MKKKLGDLEYESFDMFDKDGKLKMIRSDEPGYYDWIHKIKTDE